MSGLQGRDRRPIGGPRRAPLHRQVGMNRSVRLPNHEENDMPTMTGLPARACRAAKRYGTAAPQGGLP